MSKPIKLEIEFNKEEFEAKIKSAQDQVRKLGELGNQVQKAFGNLNVGKQFQALQNNVVKNAVASIAQQTGLITKNLSQSNAQIKQFGSLAKISLAAVLPTTGYFSSLGAALGSFGGPVGTIIGTGVGMLTDGLVGLLGKVISMTYETSKQAIQLFAHSEDLGEAIFYNFQGNRGQTQDLRRRIMGQATVATGLGQQESFLEASKSVPFYGNKAKDIKRREEETNAIERMGEEISILRGETSSEGVLENVKRLSSIFVRGGGIRAGFLHHLGITAFNEGEFLKEYRKTTGQSSMSDKETLKQIGDRTGKYRDYFVKTLFNKLEDVFQVKGTTGEEAINRARNKISNQLRELMALPQTIFAELETSENPQVMESANKIRSAFRQVLDAFSPRTPEGIKNMQVIADGFSQLSKTISEIVTPGNIELMFVALRLWIRAQSATLAVVGQAALGQERRYLEQKADPTGQRYRNITSEFKGHESELSDKQLSEAARKGSITPEDLKELYTIYHRTSNRVAPDVIAPEKAVSPNDSTSTPLLTGDEYKKATQVMQPQTKNIQNEKQNNINIQSINITLSGNGGDAGSNQNEHAENLKNAARDGVHQALIDILEQAHQEGTG